MSQLLTDKEEPLHSAQSGDSLSTVARARTLTVLGRLDSRRKRSVLQFLYESSLIDREEALLHESDLIERRHNIVSLRGADLSESILIDADRRDADLSGANLYEAYLIGTDLSGAGMLGADLSGAGLMGADLSDANGWTEEQLKAAHSLEGATMPDGQTLKSATNPDGPTFEEWLKSQGHEEDGEKNSGTS